MPERATLLVQHREPMKPTVAPTRPASGILSPAQDAWRRRLLAAVLCLPAAPAQAGNVDALLAAGHAQVGVTLHYDPAYVRLAYPGGDVPPDRGVCTDVVIRAYRALGIDLQQRVHEDMRAHFGAYPQAWGLARPDRNIDHRRVPNLAVFFARQGAALPVSRNASDYRPGDLVTWRLPGNLPHIGLVSERRADDAAGATHEARPLILHNVGAGAQLEDVLFAWPVTGHYRYLPEDSSP
jgi:uncharacterized protein YijF (DUF1287 family)